MRAAGSEIPGRSIDDVRQHDEWYSEYLILKESKKKAIQEWKYNKEVCIIHTCSIQQHTLFLTFSMSVLKTYLILWLNQ